MRFMSGLRQADSGGVTAEFAVLLPAVMVLAVFLLALTQTVRISLVCQDLANAVAREVVLNQGEGDPGRVLNRMGSDHADLTIKRSGGQSYITVSCPVVSTPLGLLPLQVQGRAVAILEDQEDEDDGT